jgi:hypothetical protein
VQLLEEDPVVAKSKLRRGSSLYRKLRAYIKQDWNTVDIITIGLFWLVDVMKSIMSNLEEKVLAVKGLNNHCQLFLTSYLIVNTIKDSKTITYYKPVLK